MAKMKTIKVIGVFADGRFAEAVEDIDTNALEIALRVGKEYGLTMTKKVGQFTYMED